jgi:uncharacterized cupredoxin-like copper-binding protein
MAVFALGAAACGGGSSSTSSATSGGGAASSTPAAAASSATSAGAAANGTTGATAAGTVVTVGESEFKLTLSTDSFQPGSYTFHAVNTGKIVHSLEITGQGVNATTPNLDPGQSADLHVTLQDGSYDLFCPIGSHKSLGMNAEVTVGAAAASTPTTTGAPSTTVPASTAGGGVSY